MPMSASPQTPIVIAFDGSDASRAAVEHAAALFPGRPAVIATVWEPGLAQVAIYDSWGSMGMPPDPRTVAEIDRSQREHATTISKAGSELARSLGLAAEPRAVEDEVDVADTLLDVGEKENAAAIVVGSHGVTGLRSHLVGSVARELLAHCRRPVVVVRQPRAEAR
jgi:nucleotide-binding universal stress UspA family protein